MNIIIYDKIMYTNELEVGDLCISYLTTPVNYYILSEIVRDINEEEIIYYVAKCTRYSRKKKFSPSHLIKKYNEKTLFT